MDILKDIQKFSMSIKVFSKVALEWPPFGKYLSSPADLHKKQFEAATKVAFLGLVIERSAHSFLFNWPWKYNLCCSVMSGLFFHNVACMWVL